MTPQTLTPSLPIDLDLDEARLLFATKPFEDSRVSLVFDADMAGYSTRTFVEILSKRDIPAVTITEDYLARDLDTLLVLDALRDHDFRLPAPVYRQALADAGETDS